MSPQTDTRSGLATTAWVLLFLLPPFAVLTDIVRNYVLIPYSDPANWLELAKQLGTGAAPARFPIGFPLYLRLALKVTGPLYVFFANVPWVLAMLALTGLLAYLALRPTQDRSAAARGAFLAMLFLVAAGMDVWILLANPYRDAPAHVLLLSAMALLFAPDRSGRPGRVWWWRNAAAGLLLGWGYCVREPTVLAAGPLALYLWLGARPRQRSGWAAGAWLAAGLGLGALPVLAQSFLQYGQFALSPYSLHEGQAIPGFNWNLPHALTIARTAGRHFLEPLHGFYLVCILLGLGFACSRRASGPRRVLLGTALLYFAFYSFYWRFFPRYFFVAALLAAPLAAGGVLDGLEWAAARLRRPAWAPALAWLVAAALALAALVPLVRPNPRRNELFRLEQARHLQSELARHIPPGAMILCPSRPVQLASIIRTLTPYPAQMPEFFWGATPTGSDDLPGKFAALQAEYGAVYWLETERRRWENPWRAPLAAMADFVLVTRWRTTDFNLQDPYGWSDFMLYRLEPHPPAAVE